MYCRNYWNYLYHCCLNGQRCAKEAVHPEHGLGFLCRLNFLDFLYSGFHPLSLKYNLMTQAGYNPTTTANQLSTLITNLVNAAPEALIVVAKIIPLGYSNTNYNSYIAKIPGVVQAHSSGHVIMVDMSTLPSSDIHGAGNVHPTDQGYADMASLWYGAIKSYLP